MGGEAFWLPHKIIPIPRTPALLTLHIMKREIKNKSNKIKREKSFWSCYFGGFSTAPLTIKKNQKKKNKNKKENSQGKTKLELCEQSRWAFESKH